MKYRSRLLAFLIGIVVTTGFAAGASAQELVSFNIPPQPLSSALLQYSEATNLELLVDARVTSGRESPGVVGSFSPNEALGALLAGTGLTYRFTSGGAVTLIEAPAMPTAPPMPGQGPSASPSRTDGTTEKPIKVQEVVIKEARERDDAKTYVPEDASTATRTPTPIRDIPQSIEVVTRKVMDDQKAIRLDDALKNISGVRSGNVVRNTLDQFLCRGFLCGVFKNGLRNDNLGQSILFRETANLQRIEVLKGPPSVLYGRSEPGGIINLVTKQPLSTPYYSVETIIGSYNFYRPTVDLSGPLNEEGTVLYRFNGAYENSESFRDFVMAQRSFVSPVITWKLGSATTLTIEGEYIKDNRTADLGVPAIGDRPAPVPISRFVGEPFAIWKNQEGRAGYVLNHRFNDTWSLLSAFRADLTGQRGVDVFPTSITNNRLLNRNYFPFDWEASSYYLRNDLIGKLATGTMTHTVLTGIELGREHQRNLFGSNTYPSIDIFNPIYTNLQPDVPLNSFNVDTFHALGLYLQDHVELLPNLKVLAGVRYDLTHQKRDSDGAVTKQEDQAFSPRVGVVYQPIQPLSLYANFTRSFQPQLGLSQDGATFKPTRGTQYEAGIKADLMPQRLTATLAFYRLVRENLVTPDPINPLFSIQTGEQRSQGIELDVTANLLPSWNIIATYAHTDARITSDNRFPVGNRLFNVPRSAGSLWTTYEFQEGRLKGFGMGAGVFAAGERTTDIRNTAEMPGYMRADASMFYRLPNILTRTNMTVQLNVLNLFDTQYYASAFGRNQIFPGAPLTFLGSIKLEFY